MACYYPMTAWRSKHINESGKRSLVFTRSQALDDAEILVPCGQCIGCRLERSRQWAVRCIHESQMHKENSFITLTYNDDHMPLHGGLVKHHFQDFMKRLRKHYDPIRIRYYMCGEYGTDDDQPTSLGRPHFHACLFGLDFEDKELYTVRDEIPLYTSANLERIWGKGFVTIGDVTFETAAYVARYIAKKITGDQADYHYVKLNYETGELHEVEPEYNTASNRPGIGSSWHDKYYGDTFKDFVTINGTKHKVPKYYDSKLEDIDDYQLQIIKAERRYRALENYTENTIPRLRTKEGIKQRQFNKLVRNL